MCEEELLLSLDVLASTRIKTKRSWSRIAWLGGTETGSQGETESLILLEPPCISILYLPQGQTKQNIPKVSPLVTESLSVNISNNGEHLVGLLRGGGIFLWKKEVDTLWMIEGLCQYIDDWETNQDSYSIFVSNDATKILVVTSSGHIYIWLLSMSQTGEDNSEQLNLDGCWYPVDVPLNIRSLFKESHKLSLASSTFFSNQILGCCCNCSFLVGTKKKLNIITLHLNFLTAALSPSSSFYPFISDWMSIEYDCLNISMSDIRDPPVAQYTHDGQILALALNMIAPSQNKILFLSPFTNISVMSTIKNKEEGDTNQTDQTSHDWITDIAWTYDDLFLTCICCSGSVCVIPRLGEPILLQTIRNSVNMGPAYFLPLHSVVPISGTPETPPHHPKSNKTNFPNKFSVSTHPHLPIIASSDGSAVTILKISHNPTCFSLAWNIIQKSSDQLSIVSREYGLDLSQAVTLQSPTNCEKNANESLSKNQQSFKSEESGTSLCLSANSELGIIENETMLLNIKDKKILFFGVNHLRNIEPVSDSNGHRTNPQILKHVYSNLLLAWKLQVTSGCVWNSSKEKAVKQTLQNMAKLFDILLDIPEIPECFDGHQQPAGSSSRSGLFVLIRIFKELLDLLRFDFLFQRLTNIISTFIHKTIKLILCNKTLAQSDPTIKTLLGCEALLQFCSQSMKKAYTWSPKYLPSAAEIGGEAEELEDDTSWSKPTKKSQETINKKKNSFEEDFSKPRTFCLHELLPAWHLLMKHAKLTAVQIRKVNDGSLMNKDLPCPDDDEHIQLLMQLFQRLNTRLFSKSSSMQDIKKMPRNISKGDRYSLESMHTLAEDAWKDQLVKMKGSNDTKSKCNILHSLLYTYLLRGQLAKAMEMVETIVLKGDVSAVNIKDAHSSLDSGTSLFVTVIHSSHSSQKEKVPCIKDPAIRQVVQSLARFMALYFCNKQLFIFPPNSPSPIPVLFKTENLTERIIPKYQEDITSVITSSGLGDIWTVDRCMEYLLLSGLVPEAAWFSEQLGDWKAALIISAAYIKHKALFPEIYKSESVELVLPNHLRPREILEKELTTLLHLQNETESEQESTEEIFDVHDENCLQQLTTTLTSTFTAGILCGADIVCWLFPALVESLKESVKRFSPNVPGEFHLPAPPYFLWQPTDTSQFDSTKIETPFLREKKCRQRVSNLVRLILAILQSSKLALPLVRWYVLQLRNIYNKVAGKFDADLDGPVTQLPDFLETLSQERSCLSDLSSNTEVGNLLGSFRTLCALLWFLHVRDNLSSCNRQRRAYVENHSIKISRDPDEHWSTLCHENLIWSVHILPFSHFLQEERWPYKVLLSLLAEIPPSVRTAQILATHCYNIDQLEADVQESLEVLLKRWQTILASATPNIDDSLQESGFLEEDSSKKKSLSVYFQEYCCTVQNILKQKKKCFGNYFEFLFDSERFQNDSSLVVGSFPFETSESYAKFLDMFLDVCFLKQIEEETKNGTIQSVPLITAFAKQIEETEMKSMPFRTMTGRHPKQNLLILSNPCKIPMNNRNPKLESSSFLFRSRSVDQATPLHSKGLFRRSQSADPPRMNRSGSSPPMNASDKRRVWSESKRKTMFGSACHQTRSSESLSEKNERTFWSFDGQFGAQYLPLNQLVDWMIIWARKNELLFSQLDKSNKRIMRSAIHVEIQPRLLVLALWLIQEKYLTAVTTASRLMSVSFSPSLTEVITDERPVEERNTSETESPKSSSVSLSEEKGELSADISIPGFDKDNFKKWLRDRLINESKEKEDGAEKISCFPIPVVKKSPRKEQKKRLIKKAKPKKKMSLESVSFQDEDRVKQAYENILQTIDEFSSASEDLDATQIANLKVLDGPNTEETSNALISGTSVIQSSSVDTFSFTDRKLSESRFFSSSSERKMDVFPSKKQKNRNSKSQQRKTLKAETLSTITETERSIGEEEEKHQESHIKRIMQKEIQNIMAIQNERLMTVIGAMLNTDHHSKGQNKKNKNNSKAEIESFSENFKSENQKPKNKEISAENSICFKQRPNQDVSHFVPKSKTTSKATSTRIGNMRGVLRELENLQISANAESKKKSSPNSTTLGDHQQSTTKVEIKENLIDEKKETFPQDVILENEKRGSDKIPEKVFLISNDGSSRKWQLTEVEKSPEQPLFSLPHLDKAPLNNESAPNVNVPGCVQIPLLSLNKQQNVFVKNLPPTGTKLTENHFNQSRIPIDQNPLFPLSMHQKKSVNHQKMINFSLQPNENYFKFLYSNPKYSLSQQKQDKAPLPLLQIPKETLTPPWPDFQIRLIPPQLIADFKCCILEKNFEKRQQFEKFQKNQIKNLEEKEKQVAMPRNLPLLVADLNCQNTEVESSGKLAEKSRIEQRKNECVTNPKEQPSKPEQKPLPNSKQELEFLEKDKVSQVGVESKESQNSLFLSGSDLTKVDLAKVDEFIDQISHPSQTDQGFIMRPGAFDNYLKLGAQLGVPTESYADIQHDLATRLQKLRHESKKVDFSTMTKETRDTSMETDPAMEEATRTAEAATSITKDTGCDPIIEAMMAYNRVVHGTFLSPEIYLKLNSKDSKDNIFEIVNEDQKEMDEPAKNTFLNVVDIPCSVVMSKKSPDLTPNEILQHHMPTPQFDDLLPSEPILNEDQSILLKPVLSQPVRKEAWEDKELIPVKESSPLTIPKIEVNPSNASDFPNASPDLRTSSVPEVMNDPISLLKSDDRTSSIPEIMNNNVSLLKSSSKIKKKKEPVRFKVLDTIFDSKIIQESSKSSLIRELQNMDEQIAFMDELALKMEKEYQQTKLFSHRMDTMIAFEPGMEANTNQNAALNFEENFQQDPILSSSPYSKSSFAPTEIPSKLPASFSSLHKKPNPKLDQKKTMKIQSEFRNEMSPAHLSIQPSTERNSLHPNANQQTDQKNKEEQKKIKDLSALTGVSDILIDLVGRGDINLTEVGLKPEDLEQLVEKSPTLRLSMQMSVGKLSQMVRESEMNNNNNSLDQRQELRQWMSQKRNQSREEYLNKQKMMRANEKQPFSKKQSAMTSVEIEKKQKCRQECREERHVENWGKRILEAEKLILNFKMDQKQAKIRITSPPKFTKKSSNTSPKKKPHTVQPSSRPPLPESHFTFVQDVATPSASFYKEDQPKTENLEFGEIKDFELESTEYDFMNVEHPRSEIPQPNSQSECTSDLALIYANDYVCPSPEMPKSNLARQPFQKMVRLQRPEITRKGQAKDEKPYVERLKEITKKNLRSGDKQKFYGTKQIPTGQTESQLSFPRELKTYHERLQELKTCAKRDENTPIVPVLHKPPNASKPVFRTSGLSRKISRPQPVPYVERLRQLSNRGTYTTQGHLPGNTITLKQAPIQRRHTGPTHKPKTYVQQLQAVNAAAKLKQERTMNRQHPYANPNSFLERSVKDADNMSDISEWTLDDKIKEILYGRPEVEDDMNEGIAKSESDYFDEVFSNSAKRVESFCSGSAISSSDEVSSHIDWVALEKGLSQQFAAADDDDLIAFTK